MSVPSDSSTPIDLDAHRAVRRRGSAATRRLLVAAATELFADFGLHGVTTAQIARRAGVATGTYYLHFPDKLALFRAIVFDALAELRARQDAAARGLAPGSLAELRARIGELLEFALEKRALMRVVFARAGESAGMADDIAGAIAPAIERRLAALQAAGAMATDVHAGTAAQARAAALVRVAAWWTEDPARATRDEVAATLLRLDPGLLPPVPSS
jgi:AcrR family transcriptional regulator